MKRMGGCDDELMQDTGYDKLEDGPNDFKFKPTATERKTDLRHLITYFP